MRTLLTLLLATLSFTAPLAAQAPRLSRAESRMRDWVRAHHDEQVAYLQRVVNIPSGTMNAAGVQRVGAVFRASLDSLGFDTRWVAQDSVHRGGHLVAVHKGKAGRARLLLIGHLDTVFEGEGHAWSLDPGDSTAHGAGVHDMKGGDVVLLSALRALAHAGALQDANITVVLTGDEEKAGVPYSISRRDLVDAARDADAALSFESGGGGIAVTSRRSAGSWRLEVTARQAHSSQVFRDSVGDGAIYEAARILDAFRTRLSGAPNLSFNPGTIVGGTSVTLDSAGFEGTAAGKTNIVAPRAIVQGDLRTLSDIERDTARAVMREIVAQSLPETHATITFEDGYPSMPPTPENARLLEAYSAASQALGYGAVSADDPIHRGAGDIAFVASLAGGALDGLGAGGSGDHSPDEVVSLGSLVPQTQRAAVLIARLAAGAAGTREKTASAVQHYDPAAYEQTSADIPVRDGVTLHTEIFRPKDAAGPFPILLSRTPYGVGSSRNELGTSYLPLAESGYIFAFQDIRGRYKSGGTFVMQRPPKASSAPKGEVDEITDTDDAIDWLLAHVPGNNGRVGMLGVSYDGWTAAMGMLGGHPALRAVSPQASPADMFIGDDFHHNGAFRLSYGFEYAWLTEATRENSDFDFKRYDTYEWYLGVGPLSNIQRQVLKDKVLPTWRDFAAHPNYDAFWQRQAMRPYLTRVTAPTLNVAGWWDQEDFYGPVTIYDELERHDSASRNFLVVGPWQHGGWSFGPARKLGKIDFGSATGEYFRRNIEAPFFAYYLKDEGNLQQPEATVFESGSNRWRTFSSWPPKEARTRSLYFGAGGRLSWSPPPATEQSSKADSFVSDPAHPVPYRPRPIEPTYYPKGSGWYTWLLEDQRFAQQRPDVLTWETEPLSEDVVVAGKITVRLFASTTGRDADWVVKLIDVYPEDYPSDIKLGGYELMVANDVFRGRFHRSFERPVPLVPNAVTPFTIDLHTQSYRFLKGHKIMVQVQSTWFPIIDRNPQTWVPNIFEAKAGDYRAQTHRVLRTPEYPSRVDIQTVSP